MRAQLPAARATWVGAVLVAAAAVLLGPSAVALARTPPWERAVADSELALPGGLLRVTDVVPEVLAHPEGMPGAMMPNPVPDGYRRVAVHVTLLGESDSGLSYAGAGFKLAGSDGAGVAPERDGLGSGVVPEGARLDRVLVFRVPEDSPELTLTAPAADGAVSLRLPEAARLPLAPGQSGHDGSGH